MILVDMGHFQTATLYGKDSCASNVDINHFKHLLLFKLSNLLKKHKKKYGKLVLCYDYSDDGYWRKDIYPRYKGNRKDGLEDSETDFENFYTACNELEKEIDKNLSWITVKIKKLEADDLIGVIAKYWHNYEDVLIVSSDQDLYQLQQYNGVKQWHPINNKFLIDKNPLRNLKEKIIRGDTGDYIPNIHSDVKCFDEKIRQKSIYKKDLEKWLILDPEEFCKGPMLDFYKRNDSLINLDKIPDNYVKLIKSTFADKFNFPKTNNAMMYLSKMKFRNLLENVGYM